MKLYLVSQKEHDDYDTYDAFVVAAKSTKEARKIVPLSADHYGTWAFHEEATTVELLGTAIKGTKTGTILGSFNAG